MKIEILSVILLGITTLSCFGNENIFLERSFWSENPSIDLIKEKMSAGHDVAELSSNGFDAVAWALIEKTENETVIFLLQQDGNEPSKLTHDGRTYIFWAAYRDNLEIMQYLIDNGAKTDVIDSHGYSLMNFAAVTGQLNPKLYDFCISNGADVTREKNHDGANAMHLLAPFMQDGTMIDYFVSKGISLESIDDRGNGIFNYAVRRGNIDLLEMLIALKVPYQFTNSEGGNSMIFASQGTRGHTNSLELFQFLEKKGIDPNVSTESGTNPLHSLAFKSEDTEVLRYFVNKGVKVDQQDAQGSTPIINAAHRNNLAYLSFMVEHSDDINVVNKKGLSAFMAAIQYNSPEVVSFLIQKGADVSLCDKDNNGSGYYLIESFDVKKQEQFNKKLELLIDSGFNLSSTSGKGNNLYHLAVQKNNTQLLDILHAMKVSLNVKNDEGYTALHIAAMQAEDDQVLKYLIEKGADKTTTTSFQETAYDLAKENEILIQKNISIDFLK
ncbi:MAG: hypothetical protein CL831_02910 [Crocinitomicaceae bacterium]|nr:hypothetical protein [Crocinitomicaceae bacterium]